MTEQHDIKKAVKQHCEMENFFSGGFAIKKVYGHQDEEICETETIESTEFANDNSAELRKIADEVKKCTKCELCATRTNTVPGNGNPNAKIVFVGEAPGADEDAQGIPFVGRAGKLLTDIISAMGLKREDVFICNILKCRPPENRDPKAEEIIKCMGYLQKQLEIICPEMIIALGAHAARTLLNTEEAIGKLRGRFHDYQTCTDSKPIKVMPTYHPAYLLRNYSKDNRTRVWDDMKKVMAEIGLSVPKKSK